MIHPLINNKTRFLTYWLIWLILGLVQSVIIYFGSETGLLASFLDGMFSSLIFAVIAIVIWFPVTQMRYDRIGFMMLLINHLIVAAITLITWMFSVRMLVPSILPDESVYLSMWNESVYIRIASGLFFYVVIILTYHLMISMENIARKNMQEAKLENMLKETELMALRSQINPHFLFNSLNSISSLTITDSDKAREMVIKLSDFMRYALSRKEDKTVPLATELDNLRLYLEIEKVRFGDKLVLKENVYNNCLAVKVPNMILQPLYENAIKHGVYESVNEVYISLEARRVNGGISISIINDFDPESIPAGGTGTGLRNVRRRLELYYGDRAWMKNTKEDNVFKAELYIPETADIKEI